MNVLKESFGRFWGGRRWGRGPYGEPLYPRDRGMGWPWLVSDIPYVGVGPSPVYVVEEPKPVITPPAPTGLNQAQNNTIMVVVGLVATLALLVAIIRK